MTSSLFAVSFWCTTTTEPWSWTPKFYAGTWLMAVALLVPYFLVMRRRARTHGLTTADRRAMAWWTLGVLVLWASSDWPIGTLGAGYLLSIHTSIYLLYTVVAAPLMLIGIPDWMLRRILDRVRGWGIYRNLTKAWVGAVVMNGIMIFTHVPLVVDTSRTSQFGSFFLDLLWLISGVAGWMPVLTPFRADRIRTAIWKCVYLFLAFGAFPMFPGAFITFAPVPLYRIYENAPRFGAWSPLDDQQLAGALMKVGNIPILWTVIAALFVRTTIDQHRHESRYVDDPNPDPDDAVDEPVPLGDRS